MTASDGAEVGSVGTNGQRGGACAAGGAEGHEVAQEGGEATQVSSGHRGERLTGLSPKVASTSITSFFKSLFRLTHRLPLTHPPPVAAFIFISSSAFDLRQNINGFCESGGK